MRICLRFDGCDISVSSSEELDLTWLSAFFDGDFGEVPCASPDYQVELVADPSGYDHLLRQGKGDGPKVEGFAKDHESHWFECWPSKGSERIFHDDKAQAFYVLSEDGTHVRMLARERTHRSRTALMRVVRELVMSRIVSTGGTLIHGSAIRTDAGVVVMSGPKRSGKTTLLISLLLQTPVTYVSNDRCVLRIDDGGAVVRGLPTIVSIRRETLRLFPAVQQRLGDVRPELVDSWRARPKSSVSPPQFRQLMGGCPSESEGPLLALVFPRVTDDATTMKLSRLDAHEVSGRFRQGLFRSSRPTPLGETFGSPGLAAPHTAPETDSWIARNVPCFDYQLVDGSVPDAAECRRFLAGVFVEAELGTSPVSVSQDPMAEEA